MIDYFLIFTFLLSLLYAVGELNVRNRTSLNYYLFVIFILLSLFQINIFLWSSTFILNYPYLLFLHIPAVLLLGPFLERYLSKMWDHPLPKFSYFLRDCGISLSYILFFTPYLIQNSEERIILIQSVYLGNESTYYRVLKIGSILIFLFFIIKIIRNFFDDFRSSTLKNSSTLKIIFLIILTAIIASLHVLLSSLTLKFNYLSGNGILIGVFLCFLYIVRQRYPEFFLEVKRIAQEEKKYRTSQIKNLNLIEVRDRLNQLLLSEKIYLEEEINLTMFASKMGLSAHQFSEYLNQEQKITFFQLINKYRIEEAKKILQKHPNKTILSIAFEVGYQNKSTFNEIFKKETGFTPTEWKKKSSNL